MSEWIPAITTSSLIAIAFWLGRNVILTRLQNSVRHEFDAKLEELRADYRRREEVTKADLRAKEADIASLRSGVMTAMSARQIAWDRRRLEAVDQLWEEVLDLERAKALSAIASAFRYEQTVKVASKQPRLREMFDALRGGTDVQELARKPAGKARPFVSPLAWALFFAYRTVILDGALKFESIRTGVDVTPALDNDAVAKILKSALPTFGEYIDKFGARTFHHLLDALEAQLLDELRKTEASVDFDNESMKRAAEIMRYASDLAASLFSKVADRASDTVVSE